jgi:thiopurine S-methyltransferase
MTDNDNTLWLQLWREHRTAFHQNAVNPLLTRFWPALGLADKSRVFVPLCGKSLDMLWLAKRGHEVIGVELSPVAVRAFFSENHLHPTCRKAPHFTSWRAGRITILCGDYFALQPKDLGRIDTVYDRASLTALPASIRAGYIAQLRRITPNTANVFLLTVEDAEVGDSRQQTMGVDREVRTLYAADFDIELTHVESLYETHPDVLDSAATPVEYKVYRLKGKTPDA